MQSYGRRGSASSCSSYSSASSRAAASIQQHGFSRLAQQCAGATPSEASSGSRCSSQRSSELYPAGKAQGVATVGAQGSASSLGGFSTSASSIPNSARDRPHSRGSSASFSEKAQPEAHGFPAPLILARGTGNVLPPDQGVDDMPRSARVGRPAKAVECVAVGANIAPADGGAYVSPAFSMNFQGSAGAPTWLAAGATRKARAPEPEGGKELIPQTKRNYFNKHVKASAVDTVVFNREFDIDPYTEPVPHDNAAGRSAWKQPANSKRAGYMSDLHRSFGPVLDVPAKDLNTTRSLLGPEFDDRAGCASWHTPGWNFHANVEDSGAPGSGPFRTGRKRVKRANSVSSTSSRRTCTWETRGKQAIHTPGLTTSEYAALRHGEGAWRSWRADVVEAQEGETAAGLHTHTLNKMGLKRKGMKEPGRKRGPGTPPPGHLSSICELAGVPREQGRWAHHLPPWDWAGVRDIERVCSLHSCRSSSIDGTSTPRSYRGGGDRHLTPRDFEGYAESSCCSTPRSSHSDRRRARSAPPRSR